MVEADTWAERFPSGFGALAVRAPRALVCERGRPHARLLAGTGNLIYVFDCTISLTSAV